LTLGGSDQDGMKQRDKADTQDIACFENSENAYLRGEPEAW